MAEPKRSLTKKTHDAIVRRLKAGESRAQVAEHFTLPTNVVGKVAAANGIGNIKPEVRKKDREHVARWLANAAPASRRSA